MSELLSLKNFAEQLNTKFDVYLTPESAVQSELIEVTELKKSDRQESFSLLFLVPNDNPVRQGVYRMEHPAFSSFELFLVPVGQDRTGIKYEAIFNLVNSGE